MQPLRARFPRQSHTGVRVRGVSRRRGATAVEFAIVAPLLFTVMFASVEFARVSSIRHTAANAAYEGARRGILPGATAQDATDAAQAILNTINVTNVDIDVTPSVIQPDSTEVTVDISLSLTENCWLPPLFFDGKNVQVSCTLDRDPIPGVIVP